MFPDLDPSDPSKMVVWMTDWHSSRTDPDLLHWLRRKGIILVCWLPNCTSVMQSPDVAIFGPWKKKFTVLKNARGGVMKRADQVSLGMEAMTAIIRDPRIYVTGAKKSGVKPFTRQAHLQGNAVVVAKADQRRDFSDSLSSTRALHHRIKAAQILVEEYGNVEGPDEEGTTSSANQSNEPGSLTSPMFQAPNGSSASFSSPPPNPRRESLESATSSTYTSISERFEKENPSIGDTWTLYNDINCPEKIVEVLHKLKSDVQTKINEESIRCGVYEAKLKMKIETMEDRVTSSEKEQYESAISEIDKSVQQVQKQASDIKEEIEKRYRQNLQELEKWKSDLKRKWTVAMASKNSDLELIASKCTELLNRDELKDANINESNHRLRGCAKDAATLVEMWAPINNAIIDETGLPVETRDELGLQRLVVEKLQLSSPIKKAVARHLSTIANVNTKTKRRRTIHAAGYAIQLGSTVATSDESTESFTEDANARKELHREREHRIQQKEEKHKELREKVLRWVHQQFDRKYRPDAATEVKRFLGMEAAKEKGTDVAVELNRIRNLGVKEGFWDECKEFLPRHFESEINALKINT